MLKRRRNVEQSRRINQRSRSVSNLISRAIGVSVGAISTYAARVSAAALDCAAIEPLADDELEIRLDLPAETTAPTRRIEPDYAAMHRDLRRKGVTLQLLWEEYVDAHSGQHTYRYTQFCQRYNTGPPR